jgi:large subunit ribosomal protein L24
VRIKKGDMVVVIRGDDKGKTGKVLRTLPRKDRVLVQGVNVMFKHMRRSQQNPQGGRLEREASIHASNVQILNEGTQKGERVRIEYQSGKRVRILKRSKKALAN